ncbi:centrosomal protein CEP57L1 isoform X2 [Centropristis striata]|uniref:centrosomal protein CEP57L1 isoform X2 n=1 Tax=Centropristis striata TaxID=184440 RepID=UPI0027E17FD4|nr:centrosomal protein CEP57L1 isoform X2 [Centropristis striata]
METYHDQTLDSPSKNSYIGSYYQPPDRLLPIARQLEFPAMDPQMTSRHESETKPNIDSTAVVNALKTLQEKIRRLELERKQAEKSFSQFSQDAQSHQQVTAVSTVSSQPAARLPEKDNSGKKELDSKLQSAEASQREKLEKLESECLKLSRTQTLAETKLAILEQKLLKEEHERKLVQEKAEELQKELDINFRLSMPATEEIKPKKKTKKSTKKTPRQNEVTSPSGLRNKKMPFVAGTSTSPSHSVHANVQSILHMMKHHQPQLCERVSALHRSGCAAKKSLRKDFASSSTKNDRETEQAHQSLGSLSDLLLALQDELGQMSFEHQELVQLIDATQDREQRQDLQRELERLVGRMEEKGAQITKLRKHQQTVHKLTQSQPEEHAAKKQSGIRPPAPSPVKAAKKGKNSGTTNNNNNLQLLRDTQRFRNSLKQDDVSWET